MVSESDRRPIRILFSIRNVWFVRVFEPVIRELASAGHAVHVLASRSDRVESDDDWHEAVERVSGGSSNVTFSWAPRDVDDHWIDLRIMTRLGLDYLRFFKPEYADAPILGARARDRTPSLVVNLAERLGRNGPGRWLLASLLKLAERAMPVDAELLSYLESYRPDVLLITPLVTLGSDQQDVLRSARHLGIPTALCVGSWDHLSSKAVIRPLPDRVLVWNERQRHEAITFHGVDAGRVDVTGAQCFDSWFDRQPARDRTAFCRRVGLDPGRPFVMYACSALFEGSPNEAEFVVKWVEALRTSDEPALREVGVLVRAHPKRGFEWDHVDLGRFTNVTLWPSVAEAPFAPDQKTDYFDSLFHSAAIVGLNTSALIEGGIVGRPVHTILLPEFLENQEGTLHFHYLLDGGLLRVSRDLVSHVAQLARSVETSDPAIHYNREFVEAFVRPRGLSVAATPVFVEAVERLAHAPVQRRSAPAWALPVRWALWPLARYTSGMFAEKLARERRLMAEEREKAADLARRVAARELRRMAERRQREAEHADRVAAREARVRDKQERLTAAARARDEAVARARAEKVAAKEQLLMQKRRERETRLAEAGVRKGRERRRARLNALLRLVGMSVGRRKSSTS